MDRCSSANRERFQFFVLLRIAFIEHAAVMSIEHWALCNASDRFEFDFNQFAIRAVIFFLWSASNFPLECGYLCVCCANCSGTASARCKCANLFDTIKFARAFFFPFAAVFIRVACDSTFILGAHFSARICPYAGRINFSSQPHEISPLCEYCLALCVQSLFSGTSTYTIPFVVRAGAAHSKSIFLKCHFSCRLIFGMAGDAYSHGGDQHIRTRMKNVHSQSGGKKNWGQMNAAAVEAVMGAQKASSAHTHTHNR